MFWIVFALKLFGCCLLGALASFLMLQVVYVVVYTIVLMQFISKNNRLPEHLANISVDPCAKSEQGEKRTNIANYSYAIKHCIRKSFHFSDVFRIIRTGSYRPSEIEGLSKYHNNGRKEDNKNAIISMSNSPFPNSFSKPDDEVFHSGTNVSQAKRAVNTKRGEPLQV